MKKVLSVLAAASCFYLMFTYWDRAQYARRQAQAARAEQAHLQSVAASSGLKLIHFYASPAELERGDHAVVCYGVENAVAVKLDPPVEEVRPSWNRCIAVSPDKTTTYHFTATGKKGEEVSAEFTLPVVPPPPFIAMFSTSERKIKRGEFFTICYGVEHGPSRTTKP